MGRLRGQLLERIPALGKGQFEDDRARVDLKLVVRWAIFVGLEEEFEDIAEPEGVVSLGAEGLEFGVGHGGGEVKGLIVPEQPGLRIARVGRAVPEGGELVDDAGGGPAGVGRVAIDDGRGGSPSAGGFLGGRCIGGGGEPRPAERLRIEGELCASWFYHRRVGLVFQVG